MSLIKKLVLGTLAFGSIAAATVLKAGKQTGAKAVATKSGKKVAARAKAVAHKVEATVEKTASKAVAGVTRRKRAAKTSLKHA